MRRAARVDANHADIRLALRQAGASVFDLAPVGRGCPDLCVGFRGRNYLLEVKDGSKSRSRQRLTPAQVATHSAWQGRIQVVTSEYEALRAIGAIAAEECEQ